MNHTIYKDPQYRERTKRKRDLASPAAPGQGSSDASAINSTGRIAGGSCVKGCSGYDAYVLDERGFYDLGTFGGFASEAFGLNDQGDVVGQADTSTVDVDGEFISVAFLSDHDGIHNLGTLNGYSYSQAFAINNNRLIAGRVYNSNPEDPSAPMHAIMWNKNREIKGLGTLGGPTSLAFALNDSGQIVGRSSNSNGEQHAFIYDEGRMRDLGTLGGNLSTARAINNFGQIVGGSRLGVPGQRHAFIFENGVMRDLGTLGGSYSEAFGINDAGSIVGGTDNNEGERHAFLYNRGVMTDLGTLGGTYSFAYCINSRGEIVGEAETAGGDVHAFLFQNGVMRDLGILP
jgi:probable HAF family extracellular repeat protein